MSSALTATLRSYNNKHRGQRGFLIGGGTSLTALGDSGFDFHRLEQDVVVGINKAYKLLLPTYLVFGDKIFWDSFRDEVEALSCIKFAPEDILRNYKSTKNARLLPLRRGSNAREALPTGLDTAVSFVNNSGVEDMFLWGSNNGVGFVTE